MNFFVHITDVDGHIHVRKPNPEMELCELSLLSLGQCIPLPVISSPCAFPGERYDVGSPAVPSQFSDVVDTSIDWRLYCAIEGF